MKSALRVFALLVAVSGLGAAALVPSTTHAQPKHASILATSPAAYPGPPTCGIDGCIDSTPAR
jgi:hypothetical protein